MRDGKVYIKEKEGRYTVYCPELDIYTQGEDIEDALSNLKEAAERHFKEDMKAHLAEKNVIVLRLSEIEEVYKLIEKT